MSAMHTHLEYPSCSEHANDDCPDEPDSAGVDAHLQEVIVILLLWIFIVPGQEIADGDKGEYAVEYIASCEEEHGSGWDRDMRSACHGVHGIAAAAARCSP